MGYIKEPKGIDFIIQSEPLTDEERMAISNFIRSDKAKCAAKIIEAKKPNPGEKVDTSKKADDSLTKRVNK